MNTVFGTALRLLVICLASALLIGVAYVCLSPAIASGSKRTAQVDRAETVVTTAVHGMTAPSLGLFGGIV